MLLKLTCSAEEASIPLQILRYDSTSWSSCSSVMYIFNKLVDIVDQQWGRLLSDFNQPLLRPDILESYAVAIYRKGSALNNVWGFIDGTTRPCAGLGVTKG